MYEEFGYFEIVHHLKEIWPAGEQRVIDIISQHASQGVDVLLVETIPRLV